MIRKPGAFLCFRHTPRRGFSLTEILVSMVVGALVIGLLSVNLPSFERIFRNYLRQTLFEGSYLIFLLKLEEDYQEAEIDESGSGSDLDKMFFYRDINRDGDYKDEAERIEYQCDEPDKQIDRRSRRTEEAKFQAVLDEIIKCSWEKAPVNKDNAKTVCHQIRIKSSLDDEERALKYCRSH